MKSMKKSSVPAALASCTAGVFLALMATASPAGADPIAPGPPPTPDVPPPAATVQDAGAEATPVPPNGTPHLASPDALPPGSTMDPSVMAGESPNVSYLRDLWHAVQNQEISGKEALLLGLAQRGMDTPYPNQAPGPSVPTSGTDPALTPPTPPPPAAPAIPEPPAPADPLPPTP